MTLFFTRHELTPDNLKKIVQTWSDRNPENQILDSEKQSARKKGEILASEGIDVVIHTGLGRTSESAQIISEELGGVKIRKDSRFRDGSLGFWDGYTLQELSEIVPDIYQAWVKAEHEGDWNYKVPDRPDLVLFKECQEAESLQGVYARLSITIDDLRERGKTALIVGHKHTTKLSLRKLLQGTSRELSKPDFGRISVPNSALYRFTESGEIKYYDRQNKLWVPGYMIEENNI